MGIKNLVQLIGDFAPHAIKDQDIKAFFGIYRDGHLLCACILTRWIKFDKEVLFSSGRKVAIDASMCLYQFIIALSRAEGSFLTDSEGETTR